MADKIRIGIIGAGGIFRSRHFPGLAKIDDAEVVAICNRSEESGQRIATEFGLSAEVIIDPQVLFSRADIDAVMIGTWPYRHCPFVLESLASGKHTFVQARMAMDLREAKVMYKKAQETKLVAQICPSPMVMKGGRFIQRLIREGYLGEIYHVYGRVFSGINCDSEGPLHWRQIKRYSGLNVLNMGILIEDVHRWFGSMKTVLAQAQTFIGERLLASGEGTGLVERPDAVHVMGEMESGAQAVFLFSSVARFGMDPQLEAYGSEGTLIYKIDTDTILGGRVGDDRLLEIPIPKDEVQEWTVEEDFINAIKGGSQPDTSFAAGVKYMEFTEAVFRSVERGTMITLPLVD